MGYNFMQPGNLRPDHACRRTSWATRRQWLQEGMTCSVIACTRAIRSRSSCRSALRFEIVEADPVVKGQTASSSYKPAKLANGARVMVPPHIGAGTRVVIMTADGSYVERAKD